MNEPGRLHAERGGQGGRRRSVGGDLQRRDAVGGAAHARGRVSRRRVPRRVGLRRGDAAGSARPVPPARASSSRSPSPRSRRRSRCCVGDTLARWVYKNEPMKFAAIELVPKTDERRARDAVRAPELRRRRSAAASRSRAWRRSSRIRRRARAPRSRAWNAFPRATSRHDRAGQHRAPRVGRHGRASARCCSCSSVWYGAAWLFRRDIPESEVFLWHRRVPPASCRSSRWRRAGWSPRSVDNPGSSADYMKVEDAATGNRASGSRSS